MKIICLLGAGILLAMYTATPAAAQSGCQDIDFTGPVVSKFPDARNACLGVETREGEQFAHFQAEIVGVSGNNVRARFKLPDGGYSETYAFDMDADDRVQIGGRSYRYRELGRGQELDIYLPNDRWEFHIPETEDFEVSRTVAVVMPIAVEDDSDAMLPATASSLPLLGLLGCVLTLIGAGLLSVRARFSA